MVIKYIILNLILNSSFSPQSYLKNDTKIVLEYVSLELLSLMTFFDWPLLTSHYIPKPLTDGFSNFLICWFIDWTFLLSTGILLLKSDFRFSMYNP